MTLRTTFGRFGLIGFLAVGSAGCANIFSLFIPQLDAAVDAGFDASVDDVLADDARGADVEAGAPDDVRTIRDDASVPDDASVGMGVGVQFAAWLDTYRTGGTIDYDGDGTTDVTIVRHADGSRAITVAGPHGPRVAMTMASDTVYTAQVDNDGDGTFDITRSSGLVGGVITRIETRDSNFDGTPDIRSTQTPTTTMVEEWAIPAAGGPRRWIITAAATSPVQFASCAPDPPIPPPATGGTGAHDAGSTPHDAGSGPCSEGTGECSLTCFYHDRTSLDAHSIVVPTSLTGAGEIRIVNSGTGACGARAFGLIVESLGTMSADLERIRRVNSDYHNTIMAHLSSIHLVYACDVPTCATNAIAFTQGPRGQTFGSDPALTVTAITETGYTPFLPTHNIALAATREVMIHELFHLEESHEHDATGFEERDHIYGCSRLAAQWGAGLRFYLGVASDASSARDGAICASMDHKAQFGGGSARLLIDEIFYERFPGQTVTQAVCAPDSMSMPTGYATCGIERYSCYCDQTPIPGAYRPGAQIDSFECGTVCPPGTPFVAVPCHAGSMSDPVLARVGAVGGMGVGCDPVPPAVY